MKANAPSPGTQPAGRRTGEPGDRALDGEEGDPDPRRAVGELVGELVERLVELVGAQRALEAISLGRNEGGLARARHLAEVGVQEGGAHPGLPRLRPRPEALRQPGVVGARLEPGSESDLCRVRERPEHAGDVLQHALLRPPLGQRPRRLALEIEDGEAVRRPEELPEMVVAVDADLHDAGLPRGCPRRAARRPGGRRRPRHARRPREGRLEGSRALPRGRRVDAAELRLHRLAPAGDVVRRDRLGGEGMAGRGRGERPVETSGEGTQPGRLVRVRGRERPGEHGIRRLLLSSFDRGGIVLAEPLEGGRPRVALVRDELVQNRERHRIRTVCLVDDRAGEPGGSGERRLAREEVRDLELRARAGFEPAEDLQDDPPIVDDRRVALLAGDGVRLAGRRREDLGQHRRGRAPEGAVGAGQRRVAPDGLEEREAEPRLAHGVDERLLAGSRWRDRDAVPLAPLVREDHVEESQEPVRAGHGRVVHRDDVGDVPVLLAEPPTAPERLAERRGRADREGLGGALGPGAPGLRLRGGGTPPSAHGPLRARGRDRACGGPRRPS